MTKAMGAIDREQTKRNNNEQSTGGA